MGAPSAAAPSAGRFGDTEVFGDLWVVDTLKTRLRRRPVECAHGQKIENHHICTISGYPRPTIKVDGLPAGLTLTRYPTEHDSWLVLNGTVNRRLSSEYVAVEASLPSGWRDVKDFFITVE